MECNDMNALDVIAQNEVLQGNGQKSVFLLPSLLSASFRISPMALVAFEEVTWQLSTPNKRCLSQLKPMALQWENALHVFRLTGNHDNE